MKFTTPANLINSDINIHVIGVGGTGSYLVSMLSQMNYLLRAISHDQVSLNVIVYDPDTVSRYNIGRQNFQLADLNKSKAQTLVKRLNMGWGTKWGAIQKEYEANTRHTPDVIFTCVDNIKSRVALGKKFKDVNNDTIWIDGGNSSHQGNVIWGHLGTPDDTQKVPNWFDLYGDINATQKDDPTESCSHEDSILKQDWGINHITAILMCQYLWRMLRHGQVGHHIQIFDIAEGQLDSLEIDPEVWKTFNYTTAPQVAH